MARRSYLHKLFILELAMRAKYPTINQWKDLRRSTELPNADVRAD